MRFFKITGLIAAVSALLVYACREVAPIILDSNEITIAIGEDCQLQIKSHTMDELAFSSDNPAIATINNSGIITGISEGNTSINVFSSNTTTTCKVTVTKALTQDIILNAQSLEIVENESCQLKATTIPDNAEIKWSSSDSNIAAVSENGLVTAIAKGECEITCSSDNAEASCRLSVIAAPKIGDYYFSDGTWGSELTNGKSPIAVVFYTGDPTAEDPSLKREKPECTHGIAVALTGDEIRAWQSTPIDNISTIGKWITDNTDYKTCDISFVLKNLSSIDSIRGYNNTAGIDCYNNVIDHYNYVVDAVLFVKKYAESVAVPHKSSGWYLPSVKEIVLLGAGEYNGVSIYNNTFSIRKDLGLINDRIEAAGGIPVETLSRPYISSCEADVLYAWSCVINAENNIVSIFPSNKIYTSRVRSVISF